MAELNRIAKLYADSLYEIAGKKLSSVVSDLNALQKVIDESPHVLGVMDDTSSDEKQRTKILTTITKGASNATSNLLYVLRDNRRFSLLPDIIKFFTQRYSRESGQVLATATTAVPMRKEQISKLEKTFAKKIGASKVVIENLVDPEILGGVILKTDTHLIDGSIRQRLAEMRQLLKANEAKKGAS